MDLVRVEAERRFWFQASTSADLRNEWICNRDVTDEACVAAIAPSLVGASIAVEIGCGIGRLTVPLADLYPDCHFYGCDISAGMVTKAPGRANVAYTVNDGRTLPFPDGSADAVYSMLLFQHLPAEGVQSYIAEAGRVLRSRGVFLFQFIEGRETAPFSWHHDRNEVTGWLRDAGLQMVGLDFGMVDPNWTWVTTSRV